MPELGPYGSVRGARGDSRPYRESERRVVKVTRLTHSRPRTFGRIPLAEAAMRAIANCGWGCYTALTVISRGTAPHERQYPRREDRL
jgi:hypothetical protein